MNSEITSFTTVFKQPDSSQPTPEQWELCPQDLGLQDFGPTLALVPFWDENSREVPPFFAFDDDDGDDDAGEDEGFDEIDDDFDDDFDDDDDEDFDDDEEDDYEDEDDYDYEDDIDYDDFDE